MKCSIERDCTNQVMAYCSKCSPNIDICFKHVITHIEKSGHIPLEYRPQSTQGNRSSEIIMKRKEIELELINRKHNAIKALNQNMVYYLKEIRLLEKNVENLNNLNQLTNNEDLLKRIKQYLNNLSSIQNKAPPQVNRNFKPQFLFDFKDQTNELFCFNPETQQYLKKKISDLSPQRVLPTICQISSDSFFLYGGGKGGKAVNTAYIINFVNESRSVLPSSLNRYQAVGEVVAKRIYIFGGYNEAHMSKSSFFDLDSLKWSRIQDLPVPSANSSTLLVGNSILITCQNGSLLSRYSILQDSHESLNKGLNIEHRNILIPYQDKVFLVMFKGVYVASLNELEKWTFIASSSCRSFEKATTSKPLIVGDNAYFVISSNNTVLCFNCSTLSLNKVLDMI